MCPQSHSASWAAPNPTPLPCFVQNSCRKPPAQEHPGLHTQLSVLQLRRWLRYGTTSLQAVVASFTPTPKPPHNQLGGPRGRYLCAPVVEPSKLWGCAPPTYPPEAAAPPAVQL